MPASPFNAIIEQHAEEAAFLWLLRSQAIHAPNETFDSLADLEGRIDAHLKGLKTAGEAGWELCAQALEGGGAGEVFAASMLALVDPSKGRLETALQAVEAAPETARGMISALGWRPFEAAKPVADQLLASESPTRKRIGLAAYAIHRKDPGRALDDALAHPDPMLCARALKAAGELGAAGRLKAVETHLLDKHEACAFWAAWSATLLGSDAGLKRLLSFCESDSPFTGRALQLAPRRLNPAAAQGMIAKLSSDKTTLRHAILAAGAAGYPEHIPWLLEQMKNPKLARIAGDSFSMITGLNLIKENMDARAPEGFEAGPSDNPEDEDVAMDPDGDFPWPKMEILAAWWRDNQARFDRKTSYLAGMSNPSKELADRSIYPRFRSLAELGSMNTKARVFSPEPRAKGTRP